MTSLERAIATHPHHMLPPDLIHDLRTPLGHIMGYSELLIEQMREQGHEEFVPYLMKISNAGRQLLEMMDENFESAASDGSRFSK
ncbi:MAG TPA: histidine kinase dimerization/phospho-acceptor domain-containing protein [Gemmatimonadaceae bacterium]|nr:histidine kinase dimerization/phospho-acceptor domain-containing protein [Gemmatimonadaceae bacterium]